MQTFLPFPDYRLSAKVLDQQRQGKQRVEGLQIIHNLLGKKVVPLPSGIGGQVVEIPMQRGWDNHPIVLMWQENAMSLAVYTLIMCEEWTALGFADTVASKLRMLIPGIKSDWKAKPPCWLGDPEFHRSHRSNLIRKHPTWYRDKLGWTDPDDLPYIWPQG